MVHYQINIWGAISGLRETQETERKYKGKFSDRDDLEMGGQQATINELLQIKNWTWGHNYWPVFRRISIYLAEMFGWRRESCGQK